MSFCTGCGNNVNPASKFCDKCGKPVTAMSAQPGASAAAAPAPAQVAQPVPVQKSGGLLKPLLIIFGVIALLAVLAIAGMVGFGIFIAKQAKIHQTENGAKIETPFGNIEADDPAKTAEKMGIDVYPGAEAVKNGAGSISMGEFSAGTATFETSDSVDRVAAFYKEQYPRAVHSESNGTHSFSVNSKDKMVVITMQSTGSKTTINLAQVIAPKSRSRD